MVRNSRSVESVKVAVNDTLETDDKQFDYWLIELENRAYFSMDGIYIDSGDDDLLLYDDSYILDAEVLI